MDEGRKRVLAIVAGILVARHLKTPEDLRESRPSPRTESLIASAVQWADRIMTRIDGAFGNSPGNGKRWLKSLMLCVTKAERLPGGALAVTASE